MTDFLAKIRKFAQDYANDGWKMKESDGYEFATNERRILPAEVNDETVFATYFIDVDEVFQAPVLSAYFYTESGHRLTYEELNSLMPQKLDLDSVSERIHSGTQMPVFFLHPCKTLQYLKGVEENGVDFMVAWIAIYGENFLYRLPKKYFTK